MRAVNVAAVLAVVWASATASLVACERNEHAARCTDPLNDIVAENCKPGNPSNEWDVNGAGDPTIQGFSTDISYTVGDTAEFKIDTDSADYRVDIYRMGYYGGLGARLHATVLPTVSLPQRQPPCAVDNATWLYDCKAWAVSARWEIPTDTVSGVFIARLVRKDGEPKTWRADNSQAQDDPRFAMPGGESMRRPQPAPHAYGANGHGRLRNALKEPRASLIYFVVRNDASQSDLIFQTSDTVWQAYNSEGGTSMYGSFDPANPRDRCYKGSYNRPLKTRWMRPINAFLGAEFPMVRFLESNGYDVSYMAAVDTDRHGATLLKRHRVFLSVGHDEYWSGPQRRNVEAARDAGMHLAFFSGNELYWRIRWEDDYRTMVCYKESQSPTKLDPAPNEWTGTFRDSRPINPLGTQPENAVTGTIFTINAWRNDPLVVPFRYARLRQWRHTKVARLRRGQRAVLHRGVLGHEMDEDIDNGFRPAGLIHLSETDVENCMYIQDFGSTFDSGSGTHHLTLYRAASGALVFGAGTVQWAWALDGMHDSESGVPAPSVNHLNTRVGLDILAPDDAIRQFTVNLFADMGVQAASLAPGIVRPHGSSDRNAPTCAFTAVAQAEGVGSDLVATVSARDEEGATAAVEVMRDFSGTWHRATLVDASLPDATRASGVAAVNGAAAEKADQAVTLWTVRVPVAEGFVLDANAAVQLTCRATDDSVNTRHDGGRWSNTEAQQQKARAREVQREKEGASSMEL